MTWSIAGTLASLAAAVAAGIYTWLTYRLVSSQSDPNVIVFAHHDESRPTLIEIVIKNIGHGMASDVRITTSRPLQRAFGVTTDVATPPSPIAEGPLVSGLPTLAPGEYRRTTWGQFGGLSKLLGNESITVTCSFKHGTKQMTSTTSTLEVNSFQSTDASEGEGRRLIAEVKRLADAATAIKNHLMK